MLLGVFLSGDDPYRKTQCELVIRCILANTHSITFMDDDQHPTVFIWQNMRSTRWSRHWRPGGRIPTDGKEGWKRVELAELGVSHLPLLSAHKPQLGCKYPT